MSVNNFAPKLWNKEVLVRRKFVSADHSCLVHQTHPEPQDERDARGAKCR